MAWNNAGAFLRVRNWVADAAAGIKIRADYHDAEDDNFAAGISNCIAKDGQSVLTNHIPWNNKRITALADPVGPQDAVTKASLTTLVPTIAVKKTGDSMTGPLVMGAGAYITTPAWVDASEFRWGPNPSYFFINGDGTSLVLHGGNGSGFYGINFQNGAGTVSWANLGPSGLQVRGTVSGSSLTALDLQSKLLPGSEFGEDGVDLFALVGALLARIEALESRGS